MAHIEELRFAVDVIDYLAAHWGFELAVEVLARSLILPANDFGSIDFDGRGRDTESSNIIESSTYHCWVWLVAIS